MRLYRAVTTTGLLSMLVFPVFIVVTMWTYMVHIDANYSYPYDMPSLAFFAGGLLAIYTRHYWPLLGIMFFGTMNRETTLFLVGIYILDAASRELPVYAGSRFTLRERFSLVQVPWLRALALLGVWILVKGTLAYHFAHNDNSENFVRLWENSHRLNRACGQPCSISADTCFRSSSSNTSAYSPSALPTTCTSCPCGWPSCCTPV